jgi:hypothetical protein
MPHEDVFVVPAVRELLNRFQPETEKKEGAEPTETQEPQTTIEKFT